MTAGERAGGPRARLRISAGAGVVAAITLLGLALRLWGIGWSLPDARHPIATYHPDELINLQAAEAVDLGHGKFDIGFYNYGAFYFYLANLAQTVAQGYGAVPAVPNTDSAAPPAAQLIASAPRQAALFEIGRVLTALMGAATIPVVYLLGRRLFAHRCGVLAATLYAIAPLAALHAHFFTVDVPATFFVALALLWSARLLERATVRDAAVAGAWCGLAAATKYNAGLVLIAPLAAAILAYRASAHAAAGRGAMTRNGASAGEGAPGTVEAGSADKWWMRAPTPATAVTGIVASAIVVFLIACPGIWLNWDVFWNGVPNWPGSGLRYELLEHSRTGHELLFVNTGSGWWYHLNVSLRFGLGVPLLALAIAGVAAAAIRRSAGDLMLFVFAALYYFAAGLSAVRFARYMLPLFPVLCVWAAAAAVPHALAARATAGGQRRNERWWVVVSWLAAALTLVYSVTLVHAMSLEDPRDREADYLFGAARPGASVAFAKTPWFFSPPLSPWFGAPSAAVRRDRALADTTRFELRIPQGEWQTNVLQPPPDYVCLSNLETMHAVDRLRVQPAVQFVEALPANYRRLTFGPGASILLLPSVGSGIIPEDILYVMPTQTLYVRR